MHSFTTATGARVPDVGAVRMRELDRIVLARPEARMGHAASHQLGILRAAHVPVGGPDMADAWEAEADAVIDALVGYGLRAPIEGETADLIRTLNRRARRIVSLDLPSGLDATHGVIGGAIVRPAGILTLALPKTGLADPTADLAELWLADIGIPPRGDPATGHHRVRLAVPGRRAPLAALQGDVVGALSRGRTHVPPAGPRVRTRAWRRLGTGITSGAAAGARFVSRPVAAHRHQGAERAHLINRDA